ncbi:hypothetical protein DTL42_08710 [Bremerella cremea]|uniref:Uncharacterized protein n=1 Tax=Bremerella cremea TaxID=1031537 RepID=A0A368KTJ4_9BACT|nr:hypothetical protein [Bremerella cremea]RCS52898.1 hypothetical protein DTL42_08710 [Bremerella cremea]
MAGHTEILDSPHQLPAVSSPAPPPAPRTIDAGLPPAVQKIVNSHLVIWVVILSFGPLGLPLIWLSPKYALWSKILVSVLTIGVTIVLPIAITLYCTQFLVQPVLEAMQQANAAGGAH